MGILLLIRHAKSEYPPDTVDRDRPLSGRGWRDADAAAAWIGAAYPDLDEVVTSPATRAQQTWSRISERVRAARTRVDERIYADWGASLPDVVADLDAHSRVAAIVGHNPGIEEFAAGVTRATDPSARERLLRKYPTSGIAVVAFREGWTQPSSAELIAFAVPRGAGPSGAAGG